ncbi:hypothetical protein [Lactobacillus delbrueckii]|uniref:hypothetical protein n=1 Tax=Lactobacillus delbrueckii TaxID=1584 RepID=UPI00068CD418|nr:hypothetical protein [Lactobacillus delbrueckii]MCD5464848.1 hypothetical protein [Lactobacillus delbrueckii subsp. bulgaricus]
MRKLYLANGNNQFKFADTATEIRLNAFDDGAPATLTAGAKVRVKNNSGYLLEAAASVTNNQAVITSGQLSKLPVGSYLIELWDTTVKGDTAIYPSDGFLALQINDNATGLSGGLVNNITVDDFIKQFSSLSQELRKEASDAVVNSVGTINLSSVVDSYAFIGSATKWNDGTTNERVFLIKTMCPILKLMIVQKILVCYFQSLYQIYQ